MVGEGAEFKSGQAQEGTRYPDGLCATGIKHQSAAVHPPGDSVHIVPIAYGGGLHGLFFR